MLGWLFQPVCPCDIAAKAWVEERLQWLDEEFTDSVFNGRPIVLPTRDFFADPYDGSKAAARRLLDRICAYMDVVPELVDLLIVAEHDDLILVNESGQAIPGAAGTYHEDEGRFKVRIDKWGLADPVGLVGTMAHELAHVRLLGQSRITHDEFDNELLTDLTVVHFGLGIFLANTPRTWASDYSRWPGSDLLKPEYMTAPMFGWALAHVAWFQREKRPSWTRHLNGAARANLKQDLRYLMATADTTFAPT
ncbi:MAG: hypothetical protein WD042_01315 [Phycisphaeraceae bacterium]